MPSCRGSSQPRDRTRVSHITGRFFTIQATREACYKGACHSVSVGAWAMIEKGQQNIFFFPFIFICRRLITLQYCSGFCHALTWISHGFTCILHPDPPSHLPLHPIPLGLPSASAPSTCLMHPTWAGDEQNIFLTHTLIAAAPTRVVTLSLFLGDQGIMTSTWGLLWLQWPSAGGDLGLHPKPRVWGLPTLTRAVSLRPLLEQVGHRRWSGQVGMSALVRFSQETNTAFQVGPGSHEVKQHLLSGY